MKKQLRNWAGLLVLLGLALWFNYHSQSSNGNQNGVGSDNNEDRRAADYLLAVSWQPAFCESRPNKPECRSQRANRFDANNFTLHGLWPQPRDLSYCGLKKHIIETDKRGRWSDLPELSLSQELRKELTEKMPGYRSHLHRHEWYKHGSCMPGYSPQDYFAISLKLLDTLNQSGFADEFTQMRGKRYDFKELNSDFQRSFGKQASRKLVADCYRDDGRRIYSQLKLSLSGELSETTSLQELINKGKNLGSSCPSGIVDPVGQQ